MSGVERCGFSDLPADQCGHCTGAQDLHEGPKPIRWEGSQTTAAYPGNCGHCGQRFPEGAEIVAADVDGDGASDEWCLLEHTQAPGGGW